MEKLRDFTVCHSDERFPAKFRIYQTATPKVYDMGGRSSKSSEWIVRSMDEEEHFGPELYRKSYSEAVANGWLTDYKIIALGVNDQDAYDAANELAAGYDGKLSTAQFLRGLAFALVMGGALSRDGVKIRSSINFMNTIAKSKAMTEALKSDRVRDWVQGRLDAIASADGDASGAHKRATDYTLEHLDAKSNVAAREMAKARLSAAGEGKPHGILNVGIFGEGTDAPSLSAVGFLEARKSPVEVIQAVGRVMRRSPEKNVGYILCPILIPPDTDAEVWLRNSGPEDGWKELGQILLALRAHDSRIEDELSDLMQVYLPPKSEDDVATMVTIGTDDSRVRHHGHVGKPGKAEVDVENVLLRKARAVDVFRKLNEVVPDDNGILAAIGPIAQRILSGKRNKDGSLELREEAVQRSRPGADGTPGPIDAAKSKKTGRKMVNGEVGRILDRRKRERHVDARIGDLFERVNTDKIGIRVNLLEKSGLGRNRAERDANLLRDSIDEAMRYLQQDELGPVLDRHFGFDALADEKRKDQADGCTIASLLLMNAAMLHQRIATGGWLPKIARMDQIKSAPEAEEEFRDQWNRICRYDFLPVLEPAIEILECVRKSGRNDGLKRALRHLAAEAERLAESYADMGADHAGPLFNKVMGNQASDGAYFTRPTAASMLARLALDAAEDGLDWTSDETWKAHRTVDLACGSGTILAAMLSEMKRKAREKGTDRKRLAELQKLAVEEVFAGLDINPVSLQLAASQLISGNSDIAYRKMGLHRMPYGPLAGTAGDKASAVAAGSLELLGQKRIVPKVGELDLEDEESGSRLEIASDTGHSKRKIADDPLLEDAAASAKNVRIVAMNPPFTNRSKMGEKFPADLQRQLRNQVDRLEMGLVAADPEMENFVDRNSIRPLFVALADRCIDQSHGILAMIGPTIALTTTSGQYEREVLAKRFHIHTLLTCHLPGQINLSENTAINESIVIAMRHAGEDCPSTRIVSLDRFPTEEREVSEFHSRLNDLATGLLPDGWGEVSEWPAELVMAGDWSAAVWRSPELAKEASLVANDENLPRLREMNMLPAATGQVLRGGFKASTSGTPGSFPILKSKGADAQKKIRSMPDEHWIPKGEFAQGLVDEEVHPNAKQLFEKAGYLLITAGQRTSTARLTAVACEKAYVGNGWMPVSGMMPTQAKAAAIFLNSTAGRLQLMRNPGRTLDFPNYSAEETANLRVPDLTNDDIVRILADCWERTSTIEVPQYRDGECEVRRIWDEAAAKAMGRDAGELAELREVLHREPHVRGLGNNQFGDERVDSDSGEIES